MRIQTLQSSITSEIELPDIDIGTIIEIDTSNNTYTKRNIDNDTDTDIGMRKY